MSATLVFQYGTQNTNKIQILFELSTNSTQLFHNQSCTITNTHAYCGKIVKILPVYVCQPARTAVLELGKLSRYATSLRENSLSFSPIPILVWCSLHTHTLDPPPFPLPGLPSHNGSVHWNSPQTRYSLFGPRSERKCRQLYPRLKKILPIFWKIVIEKA